MADNPQNDPRIKRVLKRYPKTDQFSDASMDVSAFGDTALLEACRCQRTDDLSAPRELDDHALAYFAQSMGADFDSGKFDYFLHSYVRSEFLDSYYNDPSVTSFPASEDGPPSKIPCPKGAEWCAVRPKDGKEHFELFQIQKPEDNV
jgi:hypothetical protein